MAADRTTGDARRGGRRRWIRGLAWTAAALLAAIALVVGAAAWVLGHLDSPPVKARWTAAIREAAGVDVDVASLSVSLSGRLSLAGLRVAQPEPRRAFAPDLASLDSLEVRLDVPALLGGRVRIDSVTARGVHLTVVADESGRTSLDDLGGAARPDATAPASPGTPSPRSRILEIPELDLDLAGLTVRDVHGTFIRTQGGEIASTTTFDGLDLEAAARVAGGRLDSTATLASPDAGSTLRIRTNSAGTAPSEAGARARLRLWAGVRDSREVAVKVVADLLDQDVDARLPRQVPLLRAETSATLDPAAGEVRVRLERLDAADGAIAAGGRAALPDRPRDGTIALLEDLRGEVRTDPIAATLRALVPALDVSGGVLSVDASGLALRDGAPGVAFAGPVSVRAALERVAWSDGGRRLDASGFEGGLAAVLDAGATVSVDLRSSLRSASLRAPDARADAKNLALEATAGGIAFADAVAGRPVGSLRASLGGTSLEAAAGGASLSLAGLAATLEAGRTSDGAVTARLEVPVRRLAASLPGGRGLGPLGPATVSVSAGDLRITDDDPWAWTGTARATAGWPGLDLAASARKPGDGLAWDLALDGTVPGPLAGLLPASSRALIGAPGPRVTLRAEGTASRPPQGRVPRVTGTARAVVSRLDLRMSGHRIEVPSTTITLRVDSPRPAPDVAATVDADSPRLDGRPLAAALTLAASTLTTPAGRHAEVALSARRGARSAPPAIDARGTADWSRASRRLSWTLNGSVAHPADLRDALAPGTAARLDGLSLDRLVLEGSGRVDRLAAGPMDLPALPRDPLDALRGDAALAVVLEGLRVATGENRLETPETRVTARIESTDAEVSASLALAEPSLAVKAGTRSFSADGIAAEAHARLPRDARFRQAAVSLTASVAGAAQDVVAAYPVKGMTLSARADISPGVLRLDRFVLDHPGGGTRLELSADAEAASETVASAGPTTGTLRPRSLRIEGTLDQDLGAVNGDPATFRGRGRLRVPFRIESGNGSRLNLQATLESEDVAVDLPGAGFSLAGARGRMPVTEEIEIGPDGKASIVQGPGGSPWSRVRFHDLNPYLKGGWFSVDRVAYGSLAAGPLAGNLRLDRTVVALDQMQAAWRGGTVTGQVVIERGTGDTQAWFKGDVTGVEASEGGEGLDANAALRLSLKHLEVDGRVQLIRLGRRHLRDLLDLWDPARENVSANRIRKVLAVGYPKSARVRMDGGFLSARVELGGIASIVRIDEIRGIPVGPLLRRFLPGGVPAQGGTP